MYFFQINPTISKLPSLIATHIDVVFEDLISKDALGGIEESGGAGAIAASGLEGVLHELFFESGDGLFEAHGDLGIGALGRLEGGREVIAVNDVPFADEGRAFDDIFEFANVPGPMIAHEHIDGRGRDAFDLLGVLLGVFLQKMLGEQQDIGLAFT